MTGDYDKAREAGLTGWALKPEPGESGSALISNMADASLEDALRMVDEALAEPQPLPIILYQAHRILLAAGQVERAATLIEPYLQRSTDEEANIIMQVRQACAEGRVADADRLFAAVDEDSNTRWLFLKILGRDDEARELLRALDKPETLSILSGYLAYLSFEARDYPLLWKTLSSQGINRPPARPLQYRCERQGPIRRFSSDAASSGE